MTAHTVYTFNTTRAGAARRSAVAKRLAARHAATTATKDSLDTTARLAAAASRRSDQVAKALAQAQRTEARVANARAARSALTQAKAQALQRKLEQAGERATAQKQRVQFKAQDTVSKSKSKAQQQKLAFAKELATLSAKSDIAQAKAGAIRRAATAVRLGRAKRLAGTGHAAWLKQEQAQLKQAQHHAHEAKLAAAEASRAAEMEARKALASYLGAPWHGALERDAVAQLEQEELAGRIFFKQADAETRRRQHLESTSLAAGYRAAKAAAVASGARLDEALHRVATRLQLEGRQRKAAARRLGVTGWVTDGQSEAVERAVAAGLSPRYDLALTA